ncbi:hypothetical protein ABIF44_005893 [Bradyrhizobium japonicum]
MPRSSLSPIPSNLPDVAERRALQLLVVDDDATQRKPDHGRRQAGRP